MGESERGQSQQMCCMRDVEVLLPREVEQFGAFGRRVRFDADTFQIVCSVGQFDSSAVRPLSQQVLNHRKFFVRCIDHCLVSDEEFAD